MGTGLEVRTALVEMALEVGTGLEVANGLEMGTGLEVRITSPYVYIRLVHIPRNR